MVSGKASRASWAPRLFPPARRPACPRSAAASVLRSAGGAIAWPFDHGPTTGCVTRAPARSPSTITASTEVPASWRASRVAPAAPTEPLVETSITVRLSVSPCSTRARSSITAVPDRSAGAGELSASRWETITIVPFERPARRPDTVSRVRAPSAVEALNVLVETP
jgi:hypothetical protein